MADFDLHTILMINYIPSNVEYDTYVYFIKFHYTMFGRKYTDE